MSGFWNVKEDLTSCSASEELPRYEKSWMVPMLS